MAMLRYGSATIITPDIKSRQWEKNINFWRVACDEEGCRIKTAKTVIAKYSPEKYLLSHATIIAAVETELANPKDPKSDYYIHPSYSKFINNNGDAWSKKMLAACYRSFIGADNFQEHVQISELSKGKVIDAVLREVPIGKDKKDKELTTYYVDILVATERKHKDLIRKIEAHEIDKLSMGCRISFSICSKCGKKAVDETEACKHVRYEKNNVFYDENGIQRKIAELCGHHSESDSVAFMDASWVEAPAFVGAVIRNVVNPPEDIVAKLEEAKKKESYQVEEGDFLKAAHKIAQKEKDTPAGGETEEEDLAEEEAPAGEAPAGEAPAEGPIEEESLIQKWKNDIKTKVLEELGDELVQEFVEEPEGGLRELETLDESLIRPTASRTLKQMWWDRSLQKSAKKFSKKNFNKLKYGTHMILSSNDLTILADYGYNRREFLAIMSYLDKFFKNPLSLNIKRAIVELDGTKGLTLKDAVYALQKLAGKKLKADEIRKSLTWLKLMDFYSNKM